MRELPVQLIHTLHEQQACLQAEVAHLAAVRAQEAALTTVLTQIAALLDSYALLCGLDLQAAAGDAVPAEARPRDDPRTPPPDAAAAAPFTLDDCVDAILQARGPSGATFLRRELSVHHGLRVAQSTLVGHLQRGLKHGRYAKSKHLWRLVQGAATAATP